MNCKSQSNIVSVQHIRRGVAEPNMNYKSHTLPRRRYRLPVDCYTTSITATHHTITYMFLKFRPVSLYDLKDYTKYEASVHCSPFSYL